MPLLLILVLSLPITIALMGFLLKKFPPKTMRTFYGFRSRRSVLSIEAWRYANTRAANMLLRGSLINLGAMIIIILLHRFGSEITDPIQMAGNIAFYPLVIVAVQILYLYRKIEAELSAQFDCKGRPVKPHNASVLRENR